MKLCPMD